MSWKLFLDDERNPEEPGFTVARTIREARILIKENGMPEHIAFDFYLEYHTTDEFAHILEIYIMRGTPLPDNFTYSTHSSCEEGNAKIKKIMDEIVLPCNAKVKLNLANKQTEVTQDTNL